MAKARATAVRLAPAGRAVLVLGVASPALAGRRFSIEGRRFFAIRAGRVALLATYVDRDAYAPEALEALRADRSQMSLEARSYQLAIERASVHAPIVPAGLLTVFTEVAEIDALPADRVQRWARRLTRFGERRECVILCYAGPHAMPAFDPYALQISGRATRMQKLEPGPDAAVSNHIEATWNAIAPLALSSRRLRSISNRERFGACVLIEPATFDHLRTLLAEQAAQAPELGLTWYCEGPRLPFTFA